MPKAECTNGQKEIGEPFLPSIQADIAELFAGTFKVEVPSATADLLDTGTLDSLKFVELLLYLEKRFAVQISVEDFEIENFRSIKQIARLVFQYQTSAKNGEC